MRKDEAPGAGRDIHTAVAALNRLRNRGRAAMLACVAAETAALAVMVTGRRVLGMCLGLAGMAAYVALNRLVKSKYARGCAKLQAIYSLGLENARYDGKQPLSADALRNTGLLPANYALYAPLCMHAVSGEKNGAALAYGEVTFGYSPRDGDKRVFVSGTMVSFPCGARFSGRVLLLGDAAFKQPPAREAYAAEGLRPASVNSPNATWTALTDGADAEALRQQAFYQTWEALIAATQGRAALSVQNNAAHLFLPGSFYTGDYPLHTPPSVQALSAPRLPCAEPLNALIQYLTGNKG